MVACPSVVVCSGEVLSVVVTSGVVVVVTGEDSVVVGSVSGVVVS